MHPWIGRPLVGGLLFFDGAVATHKAIYASGCVYELLLTRIERVRSTGYFYFYYRVSFPFKFYGIGCFASRL